MKSFQHVHFVTTTIFIKLNSIMLTWNFLKLPTLMDEVHSQFCNLVSTISLHIRQLIPAIELETILPEIRKTSETYICP